MIFNLRFTICLRIKNQGKSRKDFIHFNNRVVISKRNWSNHKSYLCNTISKSNYMSIKYQITLLELILVMLTFIGVSQPNFDSSAVRYIEEIGKYRNVKNIKLMYGESTPLLPEQLKDFKGLKYFELDLNYKIEGKLVKDDKLEIVLMKTSTDR